jgi:hypothetical protein
MRSPTGSRAPRRRQSGVVEQPAPTRKRRVSPRRISSTCFEHHGSSGACWGMQTGRPLKQVAARTGQSRRSEYAGQSSRRLSMVKLHDLHTSAARSSHRGVTMRACRITINNGGGRCASGASGSYLSHWRSLPCSGWELPWPRARRRGGCWRRAADPGHEGRRGGERHAAACT